MVICDRFADSSRMYQGRDGRRAQVDALHNLMIGVEPDLTILIDMDPEAALERSLLRLTRSTSIKAVKMKVEMRESGTHPENVLAQAGAGGRGRTRAE